jgi:hypothetical protein
VAGILAGLWIMVCSFVSFEERNDTHFVGRDKRGYALRERNGFFRSLVRNVFTAAWVRDTLSI